MSLGAPPVRGPHDVPNLRVHLLDKWRAGGQYEKASQALWDEWRHEMDPHGWRPRQESEWQRGHLGDEVLTLWWVSAEMVDEITHVAAELPPDVRPVDIPGLTVEDFDGRVVGTKGLVVLERALEGHDARHENLGISVDGFVYGGTLLPPLREKGPRDAVSMAAYRKMDVIPGREEWLPLGRSDWPLGDRLDTPIDESVHEVGHSSMMEDRRWMAALMLVASDHRVSSVIDATPTDKRLRRPSERKHLPPRVRVLYLRQLETTSTKVGPRGKSGRKAPHAHIVRSHPRWQACGHDLTDRKLILIPRHQRGVGDAEEGPPTVKAIVKR